MKKLFFATALFSTLNLFAQTDIEAGKTTYRSRCAACHNIDKTLVGPALKDVEKRYSERWIIDFVRSSQTMIKNGDKEAVAIYNQMNQAIMPDHLDLNDADVLNIIAYIKDEGAKLEAKSAAPAFKRPTEIKWGDRPLNFTSDRWLFIGFFAMISLVVIALNVIINVQSKTRDK